MNKWIRHWLDLGFEHFDIIQRGESLTPHQIEEIQFLVSQAQFHSLKRYLLAQAVEFYRQGARDQKKAEFGNYLVAIVDDLESVKNKPIPEEEDDN